MAGYGFSKTFTDKKNKVYQAKVDALNKAKVFDKPINTETDTVFFSGGHRLHTQKVENYTGNPRDRFPIKQVGTIVERNGQSIPVSQLVSVVSKSKKK